jgi:predicted RNA-binding protein with PIN domain
MKKQMISPLVAAEIISDAPLGLYISRLGGIVLDFFAETADMYIEKTTYEIARHYRVRVATSDALEQVIILGHGAVRVSARMLHQEVEQAEGEIRRIIGSRL